MNVSLRCAALGAIVALVAPRPADASSCIPGFDYAAFGKDSLTFNGGATTGSYRARLATGAERETVWTKQKQDFPGFADYEAKTSREIPVIILDPA